MGHWTLTHGVKWYLNWSSYHTRVTARARKIKEKNTHKVKINNDDNNINNINNINNTNNQQPTTNHNNNSNNNSNSNSNNSNNNDEDKQW